MSDEIKHIKELIRELDVWIHKLIEDNGKLKKEIEEWEEWEKDMFNDYNKD